MAKTEERYIEAVGRRKTAIARVRLTPSAKSSIVVNGKDHTAYFPTDELRASAMSPITEENAKGAYTVSAKVVGGGSRAQAEAIRHGISRAMVADDPEIRKDLKAKGFLKRDARKKERKHFGLKKARKASQWSKR